MSGLIDKSKVLVYKEMCLLFILFLFGGFIRIIFYLQYHPLPGDASGHVIESLKILENPDLLRIYCGNSSMFYKYIIAGWMCIWPDAIYAPVYFSLIFGMFLIWPYYATIKIIFNKSIAIFSSVILVFYPLHIKQSSVTTADILYYFFIFVSFYYFFRYYYQQQSLRILFLSGLMFSIASMLRFESWIFLPFLIVTIFLKYKKPALFFIGFASLGISLILLLNVLKTQDLFYSFNAAARASFYSIAVLNRVPHDSRMLSWFYLLCHSTGFFLTILGFLGIIWSFIFRYNRCYLLGIFIILLFLALSVNSYFSRIMHDDRYTILLGLILIPFASFLIYELLMLLRVRSKMVYFLLLFLPATDIYFTSNRIINSEFSLSEVKHNIKDIGQWIKHNVGYDQKFIIDADPFDTMQTAIFLHSYRSVNKCLILFTPLSDNYSFNTRDSFLSYLQQEQPAYLVLNSKSFFQHKMAFDLTKNNFLFFDIEFSLVHTADDCNFGDYRIYKISY